MVYGWPGGGVDRRVIAMDLADHARPVWDDAMVRALPPRVRIIGAQRDTVATEMAARYRAGASIRDLAGRVGRSYAWVRRLLLEQDVTLRPRGGGPAPH